MQSTKDSTIRVRISEELEQKFKEACESDGEKTSTILRHLINSYVGAHPITTQNIDVDFTIDQYPETNPHSYNCYYITASLKGDLSNISENEIIFILPDFFVDGKEPYRIDSFHTHRKPLPGYYGSNGRVLSVKFIDAVWKGAIFIYDDSLLKNPEAVLFEKIRKDLRKSILKTVSELHSIPSTHKLEDIENELIQPI